MSRSVARLGPADELPWGSAYHGSGELGRAAAAVEAALDKAGMAVETHDAGPGRVRLTARQQAGPLAILLRALPQRVDWRLASDGERLEMAADFRLFGWYRMLLLVASTVVVAGILVLANLTDVGSVALGLGFVGCVLMVAVAKGLGAMGCGAGTARIWQKIIQDMDKVGDKIQPLGPGTTLRSAVGAIAYTAAIFTSTAYAVWETAFAQLDSSERLAIWLGATVVLMIQAGFVISIPALMLVHPGLHLRTAAAIPGLAQSVAFLMLVGGLPLCLLLIGVSPASSPEPSKALQSAAWTCLGAASLMITLGLGIWLSAIRQSLDHLHLIRRLQQRRHLDAYHRAIGGDRRLTRRFRAVALSLWTLHALTVGAAGGFVLWTALQAVAPGLFGSAVLVRITDGVVALALGRPYGDPWTALASRGTWLVFGMAVVAAFAVSCGQLALERRRTRRDLERGAETYRADPAYVALEQRLQRLCPAAVAPVTLSVLTAPSSAAHEVGSWRPQRWVSVSPAVVWGASTGQLADSELDLLLAHELAHLRLGHARRLARLRWLARLTLVGDAFALAVDHTFDDELAADAEARRVDEDGPDFHGLLDQLETVERTFAIAPQPRVAGSPVDAFSSPDPAESLSAMEWTRQPWRERWAAAWRLYKMQYFHAFAYFYWHPDRAFRASRSATARHPEG